ncbi:MBL fold metallo-hydrolase [Azoarcus sp. L1K30]|uniref:MBL fold metallo-hydrolase n=1 Tax=Azoarcus sp. L1K30 TaxID=2820277 RepID=UPI001B82E5B8|nr:MBL fold metallo-hydrolase [Azoarcus sp. L1K30]MBR0567073.1 MBL fold metallo-hydrolase [Azoarcus sp. L1K30]
MNIITLVARIAEACQLGSSRTDRSALPTQAFEPGATRVGHLPARFDHQIRATPAGSIRVHKPVCAKLLGLATALALICSAAQAEELMRVTLLGTGSPRPAPDRNGPSTLVEAGGLRLMFDFGRGNTVALFRLKVPIGSIDAHFLTHMHSDHINGLPDTYLTGWLGTPYANRTKPFRLFGPKGTQAMMENLYAAFSEDRRIRQEDEGYPLSGVAFDAKDIEEGTVFEQDGVRVSAFPVDHGEHIKPAFGYRIDYRGHAVVLSGDTRYSKRIEKEATGADLLVHEVATVSGNPDKVLADFPNYRTILAHHTNPVEAGRLFAAARPKLAVYSHIVSPDNPAKGVPSATPAEIVAQTRQSYDGPLVVGEDLMRFSVTDDGVEQIKN